MGQHIKSYPSRSEYRFGELNAPSVAYMEDTGIAHFSSELQFAEEHLEDYYKSLLEELAQRVVALEDGKKGAGIFLTVTEYDKLIATGHAVDEDGKAITYDSGATYYTYDDKEGTIVDVIDPTIIDGYLPLEKGIIDEEEYLDISEYAYTDGEYIYFLEAPVEESETYIENEMVQTNAQVEGNYLDLSAFASIDEDGYLIIE